MMYQIVFINFWVIILCPVFTHQNLKNLKTFSLKNLFFPALGKKKKKNKMPSQELKINSMRNIVLVFL